MTEGIRLEPIFHSVCADLGFPVWPIGNESSLWPVTPPTQEPDTAPTAIIEVKP